MKKFVLIAIAAISFATASQAQDSTSVKHFHHPNKMQMQKFDELNLTQDQKEKMRTIRQDNMTKVNDVKNDKSLSDEQKQEKIKALRTEQRKDVEAILNADQKAKMKQLRQERAKNHQGMSADSTMRK